MQNDMQDNVAKVVKAVFTVFDVINWGLILIPLSIRLMYSGNESGAVYKQVRVFGIKIISITV